MFKGLCLLFLAFGGNQGKPIQQDALDAMIVGHWDRAKLILQNMRKSGQKVDVKKLASFVEMSQSSIYNANVLTGLKICKEFGAEFNKDEGELLPIVVVHDKWGQVTERLLQYGADPNKTWVNVANRHSAFTPLAFAAMGTKTIVQAKLLLKYGAMPNGLSSMPIDEGSVSRRRVSPLMLAVRSPKLELIQLLLSHKADVNLQCPEDGMTALQFAARMDNSNGISVLLKNGAKKAIRNKKGQTALSVAKQYHAKRAIAILSKRG